MTTTTLVDVYCFAQGQDGIYLKQGDGGGGISTVTLANPLVEGTPSGYAAIYADSLGSTGPELSRAARISIVTPHIEGGIGEGIRLHEAADVKIISRLGSLKPFLRLHPGRPPASPASGHAGPPARAASPAHRGSPPKRPVARWCVVQCAVRWGAV